MSAESTRDPDTSKADPARDPAGADEIAIVARFPHSRIRETDRLQFPMNDVQQRRHVVFLELYVMARMRGVLQHGDKIGSGLRASRERVSQLLRRVVGWNKQNY